MEHFTYFLPAVGLFWLHQPEGMAEKPVDPVDHLLTEVWLEEFRCAFYHCRRIVGVRSQGSVNQRMAAWRPVSIADSFHVSPVFERAVVVLRIGYPVGIIVLEKDGHHLPIALVMVHAVGRQAPIVEGVKVMVLEHCPRILPFLVLYHPAIINGAFGALEDFFVGLVGTFGGCVGGTG